MNWFFGFAVFCIVLNSVNFLFFRKIQNWLFFGLKFRDLLSFLLFSHFFIIFEETNFFLKSLDFLLVLLNKSFDGFNMLDPLPEYLLGKFNRISSTNQTSTQKFISVFLKNFVEINIICPFNFLTFFAFFLILHEVKLVFRLIFYLVFVINIVFFC